MGTFHDNLGELHGITVAVRTNDNRAIVGRCHEANDHHVIILDADLIENTTDPISINNWIAQATKWGVFPKHKSLNIPAAAVDSITPLNQISQ